MKGIFMHIGEKMDEKRVVGLSSNIAAGLITGACIGLLFPLYYVNSSKAWLIMNTVMLCITLVIGYAIGRKTIEDISHKNKYEIDKYNSNFLAGLISSLYIAIFLSLKFVYRLISVFPTVIILIAIIIGYSINKKAKQNSI
jgi:hypothetical protein